MTFDQEWPDVSRDKSEFTRLGRHLEFHSFLVCGEAAHTKREKLGSFSDSGSNNFKHVHSSCIQCCKVSELVSHKA